MLRGHVSILRKAHFLLDLLLSALAFVAAHWQYLRIRRSTGAWILPTRGEAEMLAVALLALAACIYFLGERYVYRLKSASDFLREALVLTLGAAGVFLVAAYLLHLPSLPRLQFATFVLLQFLTLFVLRLILLKALQHARARGRNVQTTLVVGTRERVRKTVDLILDSPKWGLRAAGLLFLDDHKSLYRYRDIPLIGPIERLAEVIKTNHVDFVFFTVPAHLVERVRGAMVLCEEMGVASCLSADFIGLSASRQYAVDLAGKPALLFTREPEHNLGLILKALSDRLAAAVGLLVLLPLMTMIAVLIRATSRGPVFFSQERCGLHGRRFRMLKFRTMVVNAEAVRQELTHLNEMDGPVFKIANDPRITRMGKILRKLSLDELPQLINVLKGEMSLVGPRPPLPDEVHDYDFWQRRKLSMKPGITCLWQVGDRNDSSFEQWMKQDLEYIDNWSLMLDAKILLRTIPAVIHATGR